MTEKILPAQWEVTNDEPVCKPVVVPVYEAARKHQATGDEILRFLMKTCGVDLSDLDEVSKKPARPQKNIPAEDVVWRDAPAPRD